MFGNTLVLCVREQHHYVHDMHTPGLGMQYYLVSNPRPILAFGHKLMVNVRSSKVVYWTTKEIDPKAPPFNKYPIITEEQYIEKIRPLYKDELSKT